MRPSQRISRDTTSPYVKELDALHQLLAPDDWWSRERF